MSSSTVDAKLIDCAVCEKQLSSTQLNAHLTSATHLANLTQRYHTLANDHAQQTQLLQTLKKVLQGAEETIQQLSQAKDATQPIAIFDCQFEGSGGASKHLTPQQGATLKQNQSPPGNYKKGQPAPSSFYEIAHPNAFLSLVPVEFHETFTIMISMNNYSLREWTRFFDAEISQTRDCITISGYQRRDRTGLNFWLSRDGYDVEECIIETDGIRLGEWQHLTCCLDRAGVMRMYLDGELRSSRQSRFTLKRGVRNQNRLGGKAVDYRGSNSDENMNGAISHVRIYNDACLTGDQIHHEYLKWQAMNQPKIRQ